MPIAHAAPHTSVVHPAHEPASEQRVKIKAIQAAIRTRPKGRASRSRPALAGRWVKMNLQIPLVLLPAVFAPPIARRAPWACGGQYVSAQPLKNNARGAAFPQLKRRGHRRTKHPEARRRFEIRA